ncbi:MAG TPA: Lrp/AsnC family transcriptional regulator [Rhodothermales bacterium]
MPLPFDDIDAIILDHLQAQGRMTRSRLAAIVGRSVPAVSARMRRLEEEGIITGFHAALDFRRLGQATTAFCWVTLRGKRDAVPFREFALGHQDVLEVHAVTEATVHVVKLRCQDPSTLQQTVDALSDWPGVRRVLTCVVDETYKETRRIPIPLGGDGVAGTARSFPVARNGDDL